MSQRVRWVNLLPFCVFVTGVLIGIDAIDEIEPSLKRGVTSSPRDRGPDEMGEAFADLV